MFHNPRVAVTTDRRIVVASGDGAWRAEICEALSHECPPDAQVLPVDSGAALKEQLELTLPRVVLLGRDLEPPSSLDVLHEHREALSTGRCMVLLVWEGRTDKELLLALQARGVNRFVPPQLGVAATAALTADTYHAVDRICPRVPVRRGKATVSAGDGLLEGTIVDLSLGGCLIAVPARKATGPLALGTEVEIDIQANDQQVNCRGIVRHSRSKSRLMGDQVLIGIQFIADDFEAQKSIEEMEAAARLASGPLIDVPPPPTFADAMVAMKKK